MHNIESRLAALEAGRRSDPLLVLAEDDDGNTTRMTVTEMLNAGRGFVRVVGGSSLKDLDRLLTAYHDQALHAADGGADDG